jgi:deazaflavin-dependent oxidoreductase (nitroreductase family)
MIYKQANPFHRFMRNLAATRPVSWLFARTLHHVDKPVFRLTKGKHTFASLVSGLPVVMLTTTGARSGKRRTLPLLGFPDGDRMVVIASNYGQLHHPSWYYNLLAHPEAEVNVDGTTLRVVASETEDEERRRLWRRGLEVYPGWSGYERSAAGRRIPVMALSPGGWRGGSPEKIWDRSVRENQRSTGVLTEER